MSSHPFRVLTLNTLWQPRARARLRAIAPLLDASGVDVICLQEVVLRRNVRLLQLGLPAYRPAVSNPFLIWSTGGLVSFSRHPVDRSTYEVFDKRGQWRNIGAADRLLRKGFLTTWLRVDGRPVVVVNTHLLANYDQDWADGNRYVLHQQSELDQLARAIDALDRDAVVVVAGDFNVPPDSAMFEGLRAQCGLKNAWGTGTALPTWRAPGEREGSIVIDHVLYREPAGGRVSASARIVMGEMVRLADGSAAFPSDHLGIEATFDFD